MRIGIDSGLPTKQQLANHVLSRQYLTEKQIDSICCKGCLCCMCRSRKDSPVASEALEPVATRHFATVDTGASSTSLGHVSITVPKQQRPDLTVKPLAVLVVENPHRQDAHLKAFREF